MADSSTTNEIRDNNMTGNNYGAYIATSDCKSNEIYNNNFINNTLHNDSQAYDNSTTNSWHLGEEGNYWSNYRNPYTVPPNGQDNYPLESPKQCLIVTLVISYPTNGLLKRHFEWPAFAFKLSAYTSYIYLKYEP